MRTTDEAINHTVFPVAGVVGDEPLITQVALVLIGANHRVLNGVVDEYSLCYAPEPSGDWYRDYGCSLIVRFNEHPAHNGFIVYQMAGNCLLPLKHIRTMPKFVNLYNALKGTK